MSDMHTQGRWIANDKHCARSNDSEIVIEQDGGSSPIAIVYPINTLGQSTAARYANATLIAAAPDLLAALQHIRDTLVDHPGVNEGNSKVHYAHMAACNAVKALA